MVRTVNERSCLPPGLLIAAPRSGSGKTTLTLGLLRALRRAGLAVSSAKCGPDYIDPAFHQAATGRTSVNLDSWSMSPDMIAALAAYAGTGSELVLAEASMGLFDGVPGPAGRTGASADVAAALGWPVLLVVDVSGQSQSAAAVVKGCATYDPRVTVAGVVLNRVASPRHLRLASEAIEAIGIPVVGAMPRSDDIKLPERHLGLVQAGETADVERRLDQMADFVTAHVRIDAIRALAASDPVALSSWPGALSSRAGLTRPPQPELCGTGSPRAVFDGMARSSPTMTINRPAMTVEQPAVTMKHGSKAPMVGIRPPGQQIAVARDAAFSFLYPHVMQGWREAGAELRFFSPLADDPPDETCDACWLPGGYPELHAGQLAGAHRFLDGLRRFARTRPIHGECGGYMVLGHTLTDAYGHTHAMAGLLSVATSFARRKLHLGYRDATLVEAGCLGPAGMRWRGHEFHYATIEATGGDPPFAIVRDAYGSEPAPAGSRRGLVSGSFIHLVAADP